MGLSGPEVAVVAARLAPKIDTNDPGATPSCGVDPAPFSTPAGAIYGTRSRDACTQRGWIHGLVPRSGLVPAASPFQDAESKARERGNIHHHGGSGRRRTHRVNRAEFSRRRHRRESRPSVSRFITR